MALTTIPSELSSVSGISDSSTSTAITINSSQEVTFAGNITTGSNTISGVLSGVTGSIGSAATATTQAASDNSTKLATTAYVTTALANLVDSAPGTLNTLNELAAALGDDANFSTTVTNSIATKLPLAGGTLTGNLVVSTTSPQIQFQTSSSHYNWQLAAQENVSGAFEISSGAQDADATNDTYTPRLVIDSSGNITMGVYGIAGNTISTSSGAINLDSADEVRLDSHPGYIRLRKQGGDIGMFDISASDVVLRAMVSDADLVFKGNDGGSVITALTFDMSDGGRALFGSSVALLSDTTQLQLGAGNDFQIGYDGTDAYLRNHSGGQIILRARTGFLFQANATGGGADNAIQITQNGPVILYHDGSSKLSTSAGGINVTGAVDLSTTLYVGTNNSHFSENNIRFQSGGHAYIDHNTVGQDFIFRTSNSSALDTTALVIQADGDVGIGTSNPAQKFHVSAGASTSTAVRFGQTADTSVEIGPVTATASGMLKFLNASGTSKVSMGYRDSGSGTDGAFRIRRGATLDSSGSFINFGTDGTVQIEKSNVSNAHIDSFATLIVEDTESRLQLISNDTGDEASTLLLSNVNKHWGIVNHGPDQSNRFAIGYHESSSSGADFANALSDAVTITSSGLDVGIGRVPATGFRLDVNDSNSGTANLLRLRNSSTGGSATAKMLFSLNRTGSSIDFEAGSIEVRKDNTWTTTASSIDSHMRFMTIQNESVTEKMRIASNGTTTIYGGVYSATSATGGMFFTGTTDPFSFQKSGSHGYINNSAGGNIYMRMGSGFATTFTYTSGGNLFFNSGDRINFYGSNFYVLNDNNVGVRLIDTATAWTTQSDERIKENITDIGSVLSKIKDYRCVEYNLKSQDRKMYGFIAQDWETDFPHLVDEDENFTIQGDGTLKPKDEEGNTSTDAVKNLTYTETIPVLLKAIQEQQALIEALQTKVAALEGE